jgi:transcriptional regulator with PAS, ATPase and Fis domain
MDTRYTSKAMKKVEEQIRRASKKITRVLLLGETGSGKSYFARQIHSRSPRSQGPFLDINCGALPPELVESELFGHELGAFTGARQAKEGLLELADDGTLFLDEIGNLELPLQAKLLTFLDTMTFRRVGGLKETRTNARIVAATNRDLVEDVKMGRFREDLYYRLKVFCLTIPPLRERVDDIPELACQFVVELSKKLGLPRVPELSRAFVLKMQKHSWPGNVRELENVIETALVNCDDALLRPDHIELHPDESRYLKDAEAIQDLDRLPPIFRELRPDSKGKAIRNPSLEQKKRLREQCHEHRISQKRAGKALRRHQTTISLWFTEATRATNLCESNSRD